MGPLYGKNPLKIVFSRFSRWISKELTEIDMLNWWLQPMIIYKIYEKWVDFDLFYVKVKFGNISFFM